MCFWEQYNNKMKLICYLQCGLGDWYDLLTMLPELMKDRNIKREDIKFYIDCIYFHDEKFKAEKKAAIKMMELFTDDWEIVPENVGSFRNLYYEDESDRTYGPKYEKIKNDFLFYRLPQTKEYMKSQLKDNDMFIHSILGKHIYEWKDGKNIRIRYTQKPLEFNTDKKDTVLIHVRKKGGYVTEDFYDNIIEYLHNKNKKVILIGNKDVYLTWKNTIQDVRGILSFEEVMELIPKCEYMITSCSMFGYHRLLFNKPTIVLMPEQTGGGGRNAIFQEETIKNENYLILNADKPILGAVMERIKQWLT